MKKILATLALLLIVLEAECIIILDRGDPVRSIRGTFLDSDQIQPNLQSLSSASFKNKAPQHPSAVVAIAGNIMETMLEDLSQFNKAMTTSIILEAKEITPRASVNLCQFARTRMSALRISQALQTLKVKAATASMKDTEAAFSVSSAAVLQEFKNKMPSVSSDFLLMTEDLHHYDETKLGNFPMVQFSRAIKNFTVLQSTLRLPTTISISQSGKEAQMNDKI